MKCLVGEMVNTADLKSAGPNGFVGSSPTRGTGDF